MGIGDRITSVPAVQVRSTQKNSILFKIDEQGKFLPQA
jgi:hypothetical protein